MKPTAKETEEFKPTLKLVVKAAVTAELFKVALAMITADEAQRALHRGHLLSAIEKSMYAVELCVGKEDVLYVNAYIDAKSIEGRIMKEFKRLALEVVKEQSN